MSLSTLLLAVWLFLVGLVWAVEVSISTDVLGWLAIITAVVFLLEGLSVFNYSLPARRRD